MKERKGNKASIRSRLALSRNYTTKDRQQDDFYATDPKALDLLIRKCSKELEEDLYFRYCVWECACGNGNLAKCLERHDINVVATDLKDRGYGRSGVDFLKEIESYSTIILTNPPYSLANEFILHAMAILPEGGVYVALMNITYLAGQKRYREIYSKGYLREVYIFSKRVECWKNNDKEAFAGKTMADFAWYVFQKGYTGQPTLYWL